MVDNYQDIRDSVSALCGEFPGAYWQEQDRERRYPKEFVDALTKSGFLAALIPEEFGGSGLGIGAAAAILEEIQKAGCNGAACHAQMYIMGTLLRHGTDQQKNGLSAENRRWRTSPTSLRCNRADKRHRPRSVCAPRQCAMATMAMSSMAKKSGPAVSNILT